MIEIIRMIKSITAKKIFEKHPEVKSSYGVKNFGQMVFVNIISKLGSEDTISKYVRNQGMEKEYKKLYYQQISLL